MSESDLAPAQFNTPDIFTGEKNARGIPSAVFIDDVDKFLGTSSVEVALGAFNELYSKYKYMETSFEKNKEIYKSKLPEMEQTLELIQIMKLKTNESQEMITNYSLSDTIYAKAKVDLESEKVYLWIGASTMVEYSHDEAIELLTTQVNQTKIKIAEVDEDLFFLRGNCITVEVNMARLFNHNVKIKKLKEAALAGIAAK